MSRRERKEIMNLAKQRGIYQDTFRDPSLQYSDINKVNQRNSAETVTLMRNAFKPQSQLSVSVHQQVLV